MGFIQTAFAASQVLGIPIGIYLSNRWDWHVPFLALAVLGLTAGLLIAFSMQPVDEHLKLPQERSPFGHLLHTRDRAALPAGVRDGAVPDHRRLHADAVQQRVHREQPRHRARAPADHLSGDRHRTIFVGPLVGKAADAFGKLRVFYVGTAITIVMVLIYTHLGASTLLVVTVINVVMFIGIFSRMIPFQALMTQVPAPTQRGSFNAINASISQLAGGLASVVAGHIVQQGADGRLHHYDIAGYVVVATALIVAFLMWRIQRGLAAAAAPALQTGERAA